MAPVNGVVQLSEDQISQAQRKKDEFRDEVSKRMGALLLRGVTMLDAYCQTCNGILMEDRNQVRTCVTCELYAERSREGSTVVADIPLDIEDDNVTPGNSHPSAQPTPAPEPSTLRQGVRIIDVDRGRWATEDTHAHKARRPVHKKDQEKKAPIQNTLTQSSNASGVDGYGLALQAVDRKMKWASEQLDASSNVEEIRLLFVVIKEGMDIIRNC